MLRIYQVLECDSAFHNFKVNGLRAYRETTLPVATETANAERTNRRLYIR